MKVNKFIYLILSFVIGVGSAQAQETRVPNVPTLTLKEALEIAMQNNYDIKLSKNTATIAKNNVTVGNAGILPVIGGTFTQSNSIQTTTQTRSDNTVSQINNANNTGSNYGVNLDWTIFDGFNMFANYEEFKQRDKLGQVRLRDTIQRTAASVIITYYDLINQQKHIEAIQGVIEISRKQIRYATDRFEAGRVARLDVYRKQSLMLAILFWLMTSWCWVILLTRPNCKTLPYYRQPLINGFPK
jgi:outer membrane protein